MKPQKAWAIVQGKDLMIWTVSYSRKMAIQSIVENWQLSWQRLRRQGCLAVKVKIVLEGGAK